MISLLRKWFGKRTKIKLELEDKKHKPKERIIEFENTQTIQKYQIKDRHNGDVNVLMIEATKIRKEKGYLKAIEFLKEIAEEYIEQQNTALVTCINKLIPYMKREESISYKETYNYLENIIRRMPKDNNYYLALHVTMAELIKNRKIDKAIKYLEHILNQAEPTIDHFSIIVKLSELYIEIYEQESAKKYLQTAQMLLHLNMDRFDYIKKQRKWYEASSSFCLIQEGESNRIDFLFNKFIELILDTAIVLNPMEIELFHERKKLYYNKERGFEESNDFISSLEILNILNKKNALLEELYTYTFEEIPQIIGLTKKQLNYKKGDPESIEEVREKMNFLKKRFDNLPKIEQGIRKLLKKYIN